MVSSEDEQAEIETLKSQLRVAEDRKRAREEMRVREREERDQPNAQRRRLAEALERVVSCTEEMGKQYKVIGREVEVFMKGTNRVERKTGARAAMQRRKERILAGVGGL